MKLLKKPWLWAIVGLALLFWGVYSAAPLLGFNADELSDRPLTLASLVTSMVAVVLLVVWGRGRWVQWRLQREIKQTSPAAGPLGDLEKEFERAFDQLTSRTSAESIFSDEGGDRVPWLVIVGPPAAGKSTILDHSGLRFTQLGRKVRGVGGTKNCVWWFSDQAIIIDTAGRYSSQEESHEEWLGFLRLLRRYRRRRPVDAVLLQVSLFDLMRMSADEVEDLALALQERLYELQGELGVRFPIYLIFGQCDHLEGYASFFSALPPAEQPRPWGFALDVDALGGETLERRFQERFDALRTQLLDRAARAAPSVADPVQRERVLCFPNELSACRDVLAQFAEFLFEKRRGRERPWLAAVFLVSARQDGLLLSGFRQKSGEILGAAVGMNTSPVGDLPIGVKGMFDWILAQTRDAARPTASALRRERWVAASATLALAIVCGLVALRATGVASRERAWLAEVDRAVAVLGATEPLPGRAVDARPADLLARLSAGGTLLSLLEGHERGGLTSAVHDRAASLLRDYVDRDLLQPLAEALAGHLESGRRWRGDGAEGEDIERFGQGYLALKASFVLRREQCPNADPVATRRWIASYLTELWREAYGEEGDHFFRGANLKALHDQTLFFFLEPQRLSALQADLVLYQQARENLRGKEPDARTVFKLIVANSGLSIREGQLQTEEVVDSGIQRAFTYTGCPTFFDNASAGAEWWSCILDITQLPEPKDRQEVYLESYKVAWQQWITLVGFKSPLDSLDQLSRTLSALSREQDSELTQVFEVMGGTHLGRTTPGYEALANKLTATTTPVGVWERFKRWLGLAQKMAASLGSVVTDRPECDLARQSFAAYSEALDREKGGVRAAALTAYREALAALKSDVDAVRNNANRQERALEMLRGALTDTNSVARQAESTRAQLIEALSNGRGAVDASELDALLATLEVDLARLVTPLAAEALQIQWSRIFEDPAWKALKTIQDDSKRCQDTLAYLNGPLRGFVNDVVSPLLERQSLHDCRPYAWNGQSLRIDPRWCRKVEEALFVAARTQCPGAPPPPAPAAAAAGPSWNVISGAPNAPFEVVQPSSCSRKLDRFLIESPEGTWQCEVSTRRCQERDPRSRARLVVWLDGEGVGAGREVATAPNLQGLIESGERIGRRGAVSSFTVRKDVCGGFDLRLLLTVPDAPAGPPLPPPGSSEWKHLQLPLRIVADSAR